MRFRLGDNVVPAPAGSSAFIPRGVAHTWQNVGRGPATLLAVVAPSGLERFFERCAELTGEAANPDAFRTLGRERGLDRRRAAPSPITPDAQGKQGFNKVRVNSDRESSNP